MGVHREAKQLEDKNKNMINHMQDFAKDSANFFNKCAKPNKSGKNNLSFMSGRILEDTLSLHDGVLGDWIHWVHNQTCVYSNQ